MGTKENVNHEWLELKNTSVKPVNISNWQILDKEEQIGFMFPAGTEILGDGFYILSRSENAAADKIDFVYSGSLKNSNEGLRLFDSSCNLVDEVLADPDWPAGDNMTKKTMERDSETRSWHTSVIVGGTPRKENSKTPKQNIFGLNQNQTSSIGGSNVTSSEKAATSSSFTESNQNKTIDSKEVLTDCSVVNSGFPSRVILINEVAWAGTASDKTSHEWIELKNNSWTAINLENWQLLNKSGSIKIVFNGKDGLEKGEFYILERTDDETLMNVEADKIFVGAIKNSDESLKLFNARCELIDEVSAPSGWPAGVASPEYRTTERSFDLSWHTYSGDENEGIFGTPKKENSPKVTVQNTESSLQNNTNNQNTSSSLEVSSSTATSTPPVTATSTAPRMLISEIMAGLDVNANYEFIELYNAGDAPADLTGWNIKKKSSTGSESSFVVASRLQGKIIPAGKYFLLANETGYNGSVVADVFWPSSYTLAYTSNTILLYDTSGGKTEEIFWQEIPKNQSFSRVSWDSNQFVINPLPNPQNSQ
ncbi:MAG: lamin tail domain-containing protein [Patescibacteria group bacterium]|nr:lamin tail domain-containing protein [Patescibacteria group bacterium]